MCKSFLLGLLTFSYCIITCWSSASSAETKKDDEVPEKSEQSVDRDDVQVYLLSEQDVLNVKVFGHSDLTTSQRIDSEGNVNLPLLKEVYVKGYTVREAEEYVQHQYREQRFLAKPHVSISIQRYSNKEVTVLGSVHSPGRVKFPSETNSMDIVDVIALAGDFTRIAKSKEVKVTHQVADGKEESSLVDVKELLNDGKGSGERFIIYPGDIIFVPERMF